MAGAGYRTFLPNEVLTADNVQNYLQDQVVQVYADASARTTALTGLLSAGMVSFLEDTSSVEVYNGTAWVALSPEVPDATPTATGVVYGSTPSVGPVGFTDFASTSVGYQASANVTGAANTSLGYKALNVLTSGKGNTAVGTKAGLDITNGENNTLVGFNAGNSITTGDGNVLIGNSSGASITTGNNNSALGGSGFTGSNNCSIGSAYPFLHSGSNNTALGYDIGASAGSPTGSNNTLIGATAESSSDGVSNQITLGNASITSLRCAVQSISSLSDRRDKTDILDLDTGLSFVNELKPVKFTWNSRTPEPINRPDGTVTQPETGKVGLPDMGFIAQDIVQAEDSIDGHDWLQLTLRDNPEKLEVSYGRLVPILVKAIQELSAEVEALKAK